MSIFTKLHEEKIDIYMKHKRVLQWISNYFDEIILETPADMCSRDDFILEEYREYFKIESEIRHRDLESNMLKELKQFHENEVDKYKLDVYLKDRLEQVLIAAKVEGKDFDEKYKHYKEALSISSRGYAIVAKRDIDEIYVNFYNPEWIKSWDGNMDI